LPVNKKTSGKQRKTLNGLAEERNIWLAIIRSDVSLHNNDILVIGSDISPSCTDIAQS